MKDECLLLKLQLKEKDELISQLQEELEKVQHLQKAFASRVDKSTQTELLGYDVSSYIKPFLSFLLVFRPPQLIYFYCCYVHALI